MRQVTILFLSLLSVIQCISQEIDTTLLIDDVVISQNRLSLPVTETARNIDVISKEDIANLPVLNIPELLQYAGGVDIRRRGVNGVQSDAGIRGGTFNQVQILINGVKMNDPQTGHHMMNLPVSIEDIERIEIIKGPAARIYGQNAFSGAINIITKIKEVEDIEVNAHVGVSSFETFQADVTLRIPNKAYNQSVTFSRIGSEGYRYNTDYGINTLFYQSEVSGIGNGLKINAGYTDRKFGANGFYANEAFTDQYEEITTKFIAATTTFTAGDFIIKPRLSWRSNNDFYLFLRDNPSFFMNKHTSNTYNGELHASYSSSLGTTGIGLDISQETLVSNNLGDRERSIVGLFLEHRFSLLNDKLLLTPGFYANKISERELKVYPGLDISYTFNKHINLFATANWSDRIPTYTNLYYTSRSEQGNENLVAESATALELGIKFNSHHSSITMSVWQRDNRNLIDWAKDSLTQEKWLALNFNQVKMTGLDINAKYEFHDIISAERDIQLTADYVYIDAAVSDDVNVGVSRYALDNLIQQLILGATFTILPKHIFLSANYRYLDRESLEDYNLLDSKLMYKSRNFDAYIGVNNIGNTVYRETNLVPMPGRWFAMGVRFKS